MESIGQPFGCEPTLLTQGLYWSQRGQLPEQNVSFSVTAAFMSLMQPLWITLRALKVIDTLYKLSNYRIGFELLAVTRITAQRRENECARGSRF